jgi:hypothetical protein
MLTTTKPPATATPLANILAAKRAVFLENKAGIPNPVHFYHRLVPHEYEMQVQAAKAFAKINDWKVSQGGFSLRALAGCQPSEPWSGQIRCRDLFDHCLYFKKRRRPAALAIQPYPGAGYSCVDAAREIADWRGLALHVPPAPKSSFHNPGGCVLMVFTGREHEIRWLHEMERGVPGSRVHRVQRYRIVGRAEAS